MQHSIRRLVQEDKRLSEYDKSTLLAFFHSFSQSDLFVRRQEKKKYYEYGILLFIALVVSGLFLFFQIVGINNNDELGRFAAIVYISPIVITILIIAANQHLTKGMGPYVIKHIFGETILYDRHDRYFPYLIEFIEHSGLLRTDFSEDLKREDSIQIEKDYYTLNAMEFETTHGTVGHRGNTKTDNHAYLIVVTIHESRFPITERVIIKSDTNDTIGRKHIILGSSIIAGFSLLTAFIISTIRSGLGGNLADSLYYIIAISLSVGLVIAYLTYYFLKKNTVRLESSQFEREFDVICNNPIEARRLLTPSMMENLVKLNNTGRKWELTFFNNKIYGKFNIYGSFLEFAGVFSSTNKFYKSIIEFYVSIVSLQNFADYLNLDYFSKETKQIKSESHT